MVNLGSNSISNILLGETQVQKMYLGDNLVWEYSSGGMDTPIVFEDSAVEAILLAQYDTTSKGYLTPNDCAGVKTLKNVFKGNTTITKFNEFKYFTGLSANTNSVVYIDEYFANCTGLTEITFPVNTNGSGYGWHGTYNNRSPIYQCSSLVSVNLNGASFDFSTNHSFYRGCTSLTWDEGLIPLNYAQLANSMFFGTTSLGYAVIPEGIISNYEGTFQNARTTYIVFPKTFQTLNLNHITRDNKITSGINIYLKRTSSITQLSSTTTGYNRKLNFYVPDSLLSSYQADSDWSTVLTNNSNWTLNSDNNLPSDLQPYKE